MATLHYPSARLAGFLFRNTLSAPFWTVIRVLLGGVWLMAGFEKATNHAWIGNASGTALTGFLNGALQKTSGLHPDVSSWYAYFIEHVALPHTTLFSHLVVWGEILVGIALIVGFLVGVSAFFGLFMNFNFMLAGTVSINPIMVVPGILLIIAWRNAGWYGIDRLVLPKLLGAPFIRGR